MPHDVEIVEALIVDVIAFRFGRGQALRRDEVVLLELQLKAKILLRAGTELMKRRDLRAENSEWGQSSCRNHRRRLKHPGRPAADCHLLHCRQCHGIALDAGWRLNGRVR